jgi:hypothetical protein
LSETEPEKTVEIINNRDFAIFGFRARVKARSTEARSYEIRFAQSANEQSIVIPTEFIRIISEQSNSEKTVEWEVDLRAGEIKRFKVRML